MDYWSGVMNWQLAMGWKCQTCGERWDLIWGFAHAECRCNNCHTEYYMRDAENKITDTPVCMLKEEYKAPAKAGWEKWHRPISEWSDDDWDSAFAMTKQES